MTSLEMATLTSKHGSETVYRIQLYNQRMIMAIVILCLKRKNIRVLPQELFLHIASFIPICNGGDYATLFTQFLKAGYVLPEMVVCNSGTLFRALPPSRLDKSNNLVFSCLKWNGSAVVFKHSSSFTAKERHKYTGFLKHIDRKHPKFHLYATFMKSRVVEMLERLIDLESRNIDSLYELLEEQTEHACTARFTYEIQELQKQHQSEMDDLLCLQAAQLKRSAGIHQNVERAIARNEKKRDLKRHERIRLASLWEL